MPRQARASGMASRGHRTQPSRKAARSHSPETSKSFEDEQHVPVDYSCLNREKIKVLRGKNQFDLQKNSPDRRFHTLVQLDLYNSLYKDAKFLCTYIKWDYIDSQRCFEYIHKHFKQIGIDRLVSEPYNWNEEVIRQFYATVYVCPHSRSITWMTDGSIYTATKKQFADAIGVPTGGELPKLDRSEDQEPVDRKSFYDKDGICGKTLGLSALAYGTNNIMRKTIFPRAGAKTNIFEPAWLVLDHLCKGTRFDVADLLIREIESQIFDPKRKVMYYAAYIMKLISNKCKYKGSTGFVHRLYKPEGDEKKNNVNRRQKKTEATNDEDDDGENGELRQLQPDRHDDPFQQQILAMLTAQSRMLDELKLIWLDITPKIENCICILESGQARIEEQLSKLMSSASCYRQGYACTGHGDGAAQYRLQQGAASTDNVERDELNGKRPQEPHGQPEHNQFQQQVLAMLTAQSHNLDGQKLIGTIEARLSSVLTGQERLEQVTRDLMTSAGFFYRQTYTRKGCDRNERSSSGIASMEVDDPSNC